MKFPVDLSLLEGHHPEPTLEQLQRSMGREDLRLRDFSLPANPYFPTPEMLALFRLRLDKVLRRQPGRREDVLELLGQTLGLHPQTLVLANGASELLAWVDDLFVGRSLALPVPSLTGWQERLADSGKLLHAYPSNPDEEYQLDVDHFVDFCRQRKARAVALCNPNFPTGALLEPADALRLVDALSDLDVIVIDESFIDFSDERYVPSIAAEASRRRNLVVVRSLGRSFGLPGMRLGYAVTHAELAERLRARMPQGNVNGLGELFLQMLAGHWEEFERSRQKVVRDRIALARELAPFDSLQVAYSRANFVYVRVHPAVDARSLRDHLLGEHGIWVRACAEGGDEEHATHLCIAARPADEREALLSALGHTLDALSPTRIARGAKRPEALPEPAPFLACPNTLPGFDFPVMESPGLEAQATSPMLMLEEELYSLAAGVGMGTS